MAAIDAFTVSAQEWTHGQSSIGIGRGQGTLPLTVEIFAIQRNEGSLPSILYPVMITPSSNG